MRRRSLECRTANLQGRIVYAVAELARAGNVPPYRLLRLLRYNGITFLRAGRAYYVALEEIRRKIPPLWRSLRLAEDLRRGAGARGQVMTPRFDRARLCVVSEVIFIVEEAAEGGYTARALGASIFAEADTLAKLGDEIRDAVRCHFDEGKAPKVVRLHFVREQLLAI